MSLIQTQTRLVNPAPTGGIPSSIPLTVTDNFNATSDPSTSNDITQGYQVGSQWSNTTAGALRYWQCRDNSSGAAKWAFMGADYTNGGTDPNTELLAFGNGGAAALTEGTINRQVTQAGVGPAFLSSDVVLALYTIPANTFDITGRTVTATAWGGFASDATSKHCKLWFSPNIQTVSTTISGGTLLADTLATTSNGGGWWVSGNITNTSVASTLSYTSNGAMAGAVSAGMSAPGTTVSATTSPSYITVTGSATNSSTSILLYLFQVTGAN